MSKEGGEVLMTQEALQGVIAAAVTAAVREANKPAPPTEQELAEIQQAQEMRKETAKGIVQKKANDRWFQEHGCTHEHSKQAGGGTHAVLVRDNDHPGDAGYILCQLCQGRFRPEGDGKKWQKLDPDAIFNTALFNKLFQDCAQTQGEILA